MEERVTGKDLWCALQIVKNVVSKLDTACSFTNCGDCPINGLFYPGSCPEMVDINSEERAKLLIKMLEQMEE